MWSFLRGKKRSESSGEDVPPRDDALSALADERRQARSEAARRAAEEQAAARTDHRAGTGQQASFAEPAAQGSTEGETAAGAAARSGGYEVVLEPHSEEVGAGIAPEQGEDDLPATPREHRPLSREDRVADALDRWSQQITGGVHAPSFLTQIRAGGVVLDLTHSHPSGLAQLLAGRGPTRLSSLVREVGALADARAHARSIREIAERHAEEVGLTTCHLGIGEAIWYPEDGSAPVHAPVLVRPITLRLRGNAREDVDLEVDATADLNPVLLRALREAGVAVDARALLATTDGSHGFDPNPVLDAFRSLGQPLPGFRVVHALVVGNLMDAAGSVAEDLHADRTDWAASPLVAALAGDEEACTAVRGTAAEGEVPEVPEEELAAAVDPGHRAVLARVLAGQDLAVATPPGTTSLDLVIDLAEELNARGRSVLIVSQRRRNLSQLVRIAGSRGLEELVFDLSPDPSLQRNASAALLRSLRRAGSHGLGPDHAAPEELGASRDILVGHVEAMHRVQEPWDASAHDAISALAALTRLQPAPRTQVRLRADVAAQMIGEDRDRFADALREAAEVGVLTTGPETTAWYGAPISSDTQAARAAELVDELRDEVLPQLVRAGERSGGELGLTEPATLEQLQERIALLDRVRTLLSTFQGAVFAAPLADLVAATADKRWREERGVTMGFGLRRRLRKEAAALQRPAALSPDLHQDLVEARAVADRWRRAAVADGTAEPEGEDAGPGGTASSGASGTTRPSVPEELESIRRAAARAEKVLDELAVLLDGTATGADLARTDLGELAGRIDALHRDREDLETLPRRTELLRRLGFDGLGELVEDLRTRRVPQDQVAAELELAWWGSVLELIAGAEPTISQYDGTSLSQVAERFRRLDAEHLAGASARVHAAADETRVETMKTYPDTSRSAIAELARSSTVSIRDLAAKYEDILFAARPAWLASPYLVPQVIPRGSHFDVVIVADGGRLPTAAALPSIVRAAQTVVVGDPLEYGGDSAPSLLDDMLRIAPHVEVLRDPHPATEGLRGFAQRRALAGEVVAVPSPIAPERDRLVTVENGRGPVTEGMEYVESTEAELRRVTDLVIEHARTRPERSLAVLTFTAEHARRLMERIMNTVSVIPALREYFDPGAKEVFTVLPADQATAVVRDDILVSVGFGMTPHGRLLHRFGPLSEAGGRKALATVITRARGRTTVVSSIGVQDLDHARLRSDGARDLRAMLWVLQGGPDVPVLPHVAALTGSEEEIAPPQPAPRPAVPVPAGEAASGTAPAPGAARSATAPAHTPDPRAAADGAGGDGVSAEAGSATELSDEDLDAAIEAAMSRRAGDSADEPAAQHAASAAQDAVPAALDAEPGSQDAESAAQEDGAASPSAAEEPAEAGAGADGTAAPSEPAVAQEPAPAPRAPRALETDALVQDLADRLHRLGLLVERDFGLSADRIELALGHPDMPGRMLLAVDTDGSHYVDTPSQRERDRLRAERLEAAGWATERVWSWALFIDPDGEAERIRRAVDRALRLVQAEESSASPSGVGTIRHRLPRPQIPAGHPLSFYSSDDFDAVVEYICSDGRARLEEHLATEVRSFLGFEQRSVLLDVSVSSAIRRYQERQ
ncbi:DUF4011 domain-containing protein [Brachybacterium saurashtrense]|uniref:DUF4011 domain-containing protein n=1 Tax=Brachybacterium saurashtrense TaxID=556288 RepID=A0A345YPK3_9MICO|nr:DUF4011 domain-containing protein [Brachybacterium saurashtrense]AXK45855.1 DUF4011 domain-containing protein [Brachybacterium saurashtrense]RRR24874.1 DUF4011 domain-containing protein [Brachybacterium saurashtrense]